MNRLSGLEALRGIAALCVLGLHIPAIFPGLARPFGKGYLGVDLFFLLSGLVLTIALEKRPIALRQVPRWFARRYWRMWPVMALGGLIGAPLLWLRVSGPGEFIPLALTNFLLLPGDFQRETYPLNVPAWTIAFILLGNLLHVTLLRRFNRAGLSAVVVISFAVLIGVALRAGSLDVGARPENIALGLPRLVFSYTVGVLLWQTFGPNPPRILPPLAALAAAPLLFVAVWWLLPATSWLFDLGFVGLAAPLFVLGAIQFDRAPRAAEFLGALSFPLYAVHFPVLIWARYFGLEWWGGLALALIAGLLAIQAEAMVFAPRKPSIAA
jgi:peptidoglycan/LPS O-acetylase OafA/YrhL